MGAGAILEKVWADYVANDACAKRTEGGKGLPVGSAGKEYRIRAEALLQLRNLIASNMPIALAVDHAKGYARSLIKSHNAQRPKDINWQLWEGTADTSLENILRLEFQTRITMEDPFFN